MDKPILNRDNLGPLPCRVRHIKGGLYTVLAVGCYSEDVNREMVVYQDIQGKAWIRDAWDETCGFFRPPKGQAGRFFKIEEQGGGGR